MNPMRVALVLVIFGTPFATAGSAEAAVPTCKGRVATIVGTAGNDVLIGTPGNDVIAAGAGNDEVRGKAGDDRICGGFGADRLWGGPGRDRLYGGMDKFEHFSDEDDVPDRKTGDQLRGGTGPDRLVPGIDPREAGIVTRDMIAWDTSPRAVRINIAEGVAIGTGPDSFIGTDALILGSRWADTIVGSPGDDAMDGGPGADALYGRAGDDQLSGDSSSKQRAADILRGGLGNDLLDTEGGRDTLRGGPGDDKLGDRGDSADILRGGAGNDFMFDFLSYKEGLQRFRGGAGRDSLRLLDDFVDIPGKNMAATWNMATGPLVYRPEGGQGLKATATGFESAFPFSFNASWSISGTEGDDFVDASETRGTDFRGLEGNDTFNGSPYDDTFDGGLGIDHSVFMGDGDDTCISVEVRDGDCETVKP